MAAQVGDQVIVQGMPGVVVNTQVVLGVQYDTVLFTQPVIRVVDDADVQEQTQAALAKKASKPAATAASPHVPIKPK